MKNKIDIKDKISIYCVLYIVASAVAVLPLFKEYALESGIIEEWLGRVEEIAMGMDFGCFFLFPSSELLVNVDVKLNAMNSNLWYLFSGLLYKLSGNMVLTYRIFMLAVQIGTALTAFWFFKKIFGRKGSEMPVLFGALLYMTCPYRIYICYDLCNMSQAVAWMLIPLYAMFAYKVLCGEDGIRALLLAALVLGGIGYADMIIMFIAVCVTLIAAFVKKNVRILVAPVLGSLISAPGVYRLVQYLFLEGLEEVEIPLKTIMSEGYRFGEFFTSYARLEDHPGMGMGLMLCLLTGMWLKFVAGEKEQSAEDSAGIAETKHMKAIFWTALFFCLLGTRYFPWDVVQRLGIWTLKFVSLLDTPAIFCGVGYAMLCVPAAEYMNRISKNENRLLAQAVPVVVFIFCVAGCVGL